MVVESGHCNIPGLNGKLFLCMYFEKSGLKLTPFQFDDHQERRMLIADRVREAVSKVDEAHTKGAVHIDNTLSRLDKLSKLIAKMDECLSD